MKVVHLLPAMEQGGVETVVLTLNRALVAAGWNSVVISRGGKLVANVERDGGRHLALDLKSKNPLTYFSRAWQLRRRLAAEKPDLVCVHSRVPAWLFVWANRTLHLPWITYAHGANSVSRYSAVMTKGDRIIVPSQFLADFLMANYKFDRAKLRVIPNAVDSEKFNPDKLDHEFMEAKRREWGLEERKVVMAVGRITPVKGFDTLIRAVEKVEVEVEVEAEAEAEAEVAEPQRNWKLVIVGDADRHHLDYARSLSSLISHLSSLISFAGSQRKIPECLALADVLVSSNTLKPESFGLTLVEALMMGKPVVAKEFGGAKEIIVDGENGVFTTGDTPEAFAAAIAKALSTPFDPAKLRADAIRRFSLASMTEQTLAVYGELGQRAEGRGLRSEG